MDDRSSCENSSRTTMKGDSQLVYSNGNTSVGELGVSAVVAMGEKCAGCVVGRVSS